MVLLRLRKRLILARRGHKLLKDKLEGLVKEFMPIVEKYGKARGEVDRELPLALAQFVIAGASSGDAAVEAAIEECETRLEVTCSRRLVMNIPVPELRMAGFEIKSSYSTVATSSDFDGALSALREVFPKLLQLAELEEAVLRLAGEIEKTRRRVNALEYVLVPQLAGTVKEISAKLDEADRGNRARLMKIKDMLRTAAD
jgi:V/A-type H+-transporting ATPase subunit D